MRTLKMLHKWFLYIHQRHVELWNLRCALMLILNKRKQSNPGVFYHLGLGTSGYYTLGTAEKTAHYIVYIYSLPSTTNADPHFPQGLQFNREIRCGKNCIKLLASHIPVAPKRNASFWKEKNNEYVNRISDLESKCDGCLTQCPPYYVSIHSTMTQTNWGNLIE